jgi:hypothetical protein
MTSTAPIHYLLRVGDGQHFISSQSYMRWGVNSAHRGWVPKFLKDVKPGDILWFIQSESKGKVLGVATFVRHCPRELGPLIAVTPTDAELGWTQTAGEWDTEIHYKDLYDVSGCDIHTDIKSPLVGRKYNPLKCAVNLPEEYPRIVKYCSAVKI